MLAEEDPDFESRQATTTHCRVDATKAIGVLLLSMNEILRLCRQVLIFFLTLLAVAWVSGEGFQWLLRWRAERLLTDVRTLTVNRSGWTDAQQMMKKWGPWSVPTASCTEQSCTYQINVIQSLLPILGGTPGSGSKNWLPIMLGHLGLRSAAARAGFIVQHGVISEKWFGEQVTLPVQDWEPSASYVPYLSVSSHQSVKFHDHPRDPDQVFADRLVRIYPHGMNVNFAVDEDASEQALLLDYRFNCITQIRPCREVADILPEGWRTLQAEQHPVNTR